MSSCKDHCLNTVKVTRDLYLGLKFKQMWDLAFEGYPDSTSNLITAPWIFEDISVCLTCYKICKTNPDMNHHYTTTKHKMYFGLRNLSLFCVECHTAFVCPEMLSEFCVRSIMSYPGESQEVGFYNLGSSCYSNAVLIALSHCQALVTATCASHVPICRLFSGAATMDRRFNTTIPAFLKKFSPRVQEDAGEYLTYLIDLLSKDKRVKDVLTGKVVTHQHCHSCKHHAKSSEEFTILPVNISETGWEGRVPDCPSMARSYGHENLFDVTSGGSFGHSVVSLIQHGSTARISLERSLANMCTSTKIVCSECKSKDASLYVNIEELPEVLILQITRFGRRWFGLGKVYKMIRFPDQDVDFSHFVEEEIDCGPSRYSLTAVVFHSGFMNLGHYQCYAKRHNAWYLFNDNKVTRVSREDVLTSQAYLLFYTKNESEDVSTIRGNLARASGKMDVDFGIDVHIFSNPKQWIGRIPHDRGDEYFAEASAFAGGDVLTDPDEYTVVSNFVTKMSWCEKTIKLPVSHVNAVWSYLTKKTIDDGNNGDEEIEVAEPVADLYARLEFLKDLEKAEQTPESQTSEHEATNEQPITDATNE